MFAKGALRYVPFCLTVALVAAAIADPIVEAISNAGIFGAGTFTDHSTADVVPVLSIGAIASLLSLFALVRRALGLGSGLLAVPRQAQDDKGLFPVIFGFELCVLLVMETLEQVAVHGHVLGALTWLGGPVLASLVIHAIVTAFTTFGLARVLRCGAIAIVTAVRFIARLVMLPVPRVASEFSLSYRFWRKRPAAPILCRIGERAPPLQA